MLCRPRRNRRNAIIRAMTQETHLHLSDLVHPLFVQEGEKAPIQSIPYNYKHSIETVLKEVEKNLQLGIRSVALFPNIRPELKNEQGSESLNRNGLYIRALSAIKERFPEVWLISDVALDPYTSHGHDGFVDNGKILNDQTIERLAKIAVLHGSVGVDMVAPSDMMDGRVRAIREALDQKGFVDVGILSYTAKYASAFYGPFREALSSAPSSGDKRSYQMNPANRKEAALEALLDQQEGADCMMVKPALLYLDVIQSLHTQSSIPIAAYHVSGEYAMLMAGAEKGWLDRDQALIETMMSIKRAGARFIFTYAAQRIAELVHQDIAS